MDLKGRCDVIGLPSLLLMIEAGRMTGTLRISRVNPVEDGLIYLVSGQIHRAELRPREDLRGREAVIALMNRADGTFEFTPETLDVGNEVHHTTAQIVVEAARRLDGPR
ncbi:MAG TPA: DUF4388 domain-containing protein [Planctomycetota bacterium]